LTAICRAATEHSMRERFTTTAARRNSMRIATHSEPGAIAKFLARNDKTKPSLRDPYNAYHEINHLNRRRLFFGNT